MNQNIIELERAVVGAALLEQGVYARLANILKPNNLTGLRKSLWESMRNMWPSKPIDMLTVYEEHQRCRTTEGKALIQEIMACTQRVNSSENSSAHAFLILEHCIRQEAVQKLTSKRLKCKTDTLDSLIEVKAIEDALTALNDNSKDVLSLIPAISQYFESKGLLSLAEMLGSLDDYISERARQIRSIDHYERIKNEYTRLKACYEPE